MWDNTAVMLGELLAGRYRLEERIASGGMGSVWRAHDELLQRSVAVKLLHSTMAGEPKAAERFRREALTAASISHPNMANVFDYVQEGEHPGIVMELIDGETLAARIGRGRSVTVAEALRIADAVLAALEVAHGANIVHRDIKPANILLTQTGEVKVTDFGIAQVPGDASLTMTGTVLGTMNYAAPEQIRGEPVNPATDLHAVGAVLFEMLSGKPPFEGDTPTAVAMARLNGEAAHVSERRAGITAALDTAVARALERDPAARFSSATQMRAALRSAGVAEATPRQLLDQTQIYPNGSADETVAFTLPPEPDASRTPLTHRIRGLLARLALPLAVIIVLVSAITFASTRPTTTEVPSFVGKTLEQARSLAADERLEIKVVERTNSATAGTVLRQDPAANTSVERGSVVTLTVSKGPPACCAVPNVIGQKPNDAIDLLKQAGFTADVKVVTKITEDGEEGRVIAQTPSQGSRVAPDEQITITVVARPERRGKGKGRD